MVRQPPPFSDPPICRRATFNGIVRGNDDQAIAITNGAVLLQSGSHTTYDKVYRSAKNPPANGNHANDPDDNDDDDGDNDGDDTGIEYAYLFEPSQDTHLCDAQLGKVYRGRVLRRRVGDPYWRLTSERCAIKVMPWAKIIEREGRTENPRNEIAAMYHMRAYYDSTLRNDNNTDGGNATIPTAREVMRETNIIMPLDILYDDTNLYSIMPMCDGGELYDAVSNFTEEACLTKIMPQILNGLEWLQRAKICHRDISLENFMLDGEGDEMKVIIIDFGMALQIPYENDGTTRNLIAAPHRCGKIAYMCPEIYDQFDLSVPFDGHAADLWPTAICMFTMIAGIHPWMQTSPSTLYDCYRYMSQGHLSTICRNLGPNGHGLDQSVISDTSLDLLQRMLRSKLSDRLISLEQIRALLNR